MAVHVQPVRRPPADLLQRAGPRMTKVLDNFTGVVRRWGANGGGTSVRVADKPR